MLHDMMFGLLDASVKISTFSNFDKVLDKLLTILHDKNDVKLKYNESPSTLNTKRLQIIPLFYLIYFHVVILLNSFQYAFPVYGRQKV